MSAMLVTGAFGQIGTELVAALYDRHGAENVLATSHRLPESAAALAGPTAVLDVTDAAAVLEMCTRH